MKVFLLRGKSPLTQKNARMHKMFEEGRIHFLISAAGLPKVSVKEQSASEMP